MKISSLSWDASKSDVDNLIANAMGTLMGYSMSYELLHKQIWRKARYRVSTYTNKSYTSHNGRAVQFIKLWNIKSGSKAPYSYEGDANTFGLNQLFMGQDYRKPYVGNPKNGIYHDDCYIQPKTLTVCPDLTCHGSLIKEEQLLVAGTTKYPKYGWIKYFEDGFVVRYGYSRFRKDIGTIFLKQYKVMPMVYIDTGDLTIDHIDFLDNWDDWFELIVHEDSDFWSGFIKFVAMIVVAVVAIYTGVAYNIVGFLGLVATEVGIITDSQMLSLIGGLMIGGVALYNSWETSFAAVAENSATQATTLSLSSSYFQGAMGEAFANYPSMAGMGNLVAMDEMFALSSAYTTASMQSVLAPYAIGSVGVAGTMSNSLDYYSIAKQISDIGSNVYKMATYKSTSASTSTDSEDDSMKLYYENSKKKKDPFDPNSVIDIL